MIKILIVTALLFTGKSNAQQVYNKLSVKELDVTSRVNVASTTQASKPCPAMTETQRNAIGTPLNGSCIYNTTTSKLNVYSGSIWKAAGGGVDNWATSTVYAVNDLVIESAKIYQCLIAHTSGTFATDLAALKWSEISSTVPVNLTGPITSVGNNTSIASQTGTGTKFVVDTSPTLVTPNIGAATGTSLALTGNISAYNYEVDNLLVNGGFENTISSEWTCTVGTCSRTTTSGEFSKGTAALKVALSAQAMNVSQTVNTPLGIQKQGYVRVLYRVPATMADFQICSIVNSAEQTCVPTNNLVKDDTFRSIEIPLTFNATNAGIKFKTTSSYTANAYFDAAIVAQGLGTQNLQLDNVYSATITAAGVTSLENKDWISGNASVASNVFTITFTAGTFTAAPNCEVSINENLIGIEKSAAVYSVSATQATVATKNTSIGNAAYQFTLLCQKSGNDYLASSANVYSSTNGNYSRRAYTPTFTGFGTVSGVDCYESREGEFNTIDCKFTSGTSTAVEARVSLPGTNVSSALIGSIKTVGTGSLSVANSAAYNMLAEQSVGYLTFGFQSASIAGLSKQLGSGLLVSGNTMSFTARVPIAGWSNSNVIVGSFEKIEKCSGSTECVDVFSAQVTTTSGAVANSNVSPNWLSCTAVAAPVCTFTAGIFTVAPNCVASFGTNSGAAESGVAASASVTSATSMTLRAINTSTGGDLSSRTLSVSCQKSGVDSKPKTAKVASSIGVPTVPGITTQAIDTFSVSFGTTNATTVCSASPCSYLDQIGNAVASITRSGVGAYSLNTAKTYIKLKCTGSGNSRIISDASCANCSSVAFASQNTATTADSYGVISCQGSY